MKYTQSPTQKKFKISAHIIGEILCAIAIFAVFTVPAWLPSVIKGF